MIDIATPQFPGEPAFRSALMRLGIAGGAQDLLVHEEMTDGEPSRREGGKIRLVWDTVLAYVVQRTLTEFPKELQSQATATALTRLILVADLCHPGERRHTALRKLTGNKRTRQAGDWNLAVAGAVAWQWTDRLIDLEPVAAGAMLSVSHQVPPADPGPGSIKAQLKVCIPPAGNDLLPKAWLKPLVTDGLRQSAGRKRRFDLPGVGFAGSAADWSTLVNFVLDARPGSGPGPLASPRPQDLIVIVPARR